MKTLAKRPFKKLSPKYFGPYTTLEQNSTVAYKVRQRLYASALKWRNFRIMKPLEWMSPLWRNNFLISKLRTIWFSKGGIDWEPTSTYLEKRKKQKHAHVTHAPSTSDHTLDETREANYL